MRLIVCATVATLAMSLAGVSQAKHDAVKRPDRINKLRHVIDSHRQATWHWQDKAKVRRWSTWHRERHVTAAPVLHRLLHLWKIRNHAARMLYKRISAVPSHYAGWMCIHASEGSWTSQTGNGFYGGLQMTYGWMGLVSNAALLSPGQQMQAAETGYRNSGYSDSWMRGQWPNTYPPCAHLF